MKGQLLLTLLTLPPSSPSLMEGLASHTTSGPKGIFSPSLFGPHHAARHEEADNPAPPLVLSGD